MTGPKNLDRTSVHQALAQELDDLCTSAESPHGQAPPTINQQQITSLHHKLGAPIPAIYRAALEKGILPLRYLRNYPAISVSEQMKLATSRAVVVGAGGLGGQILLSLARMGVGQLIVVDPSRFEESNLNRQALCTPLSLGMTKAHTAQSVVEDLNPAVEVTIHPVRLTVKNRMQILTDAHVAADALDSIQDRLILEEGTKKAGIPLVHAAIDGFFGQLMTVYPQDPGLTRIYGSGDGLQPASHGNLPMTALTMANLQAMEVLKVLLGRGRPIRNTMLTMELEEGLMEQFSFPQP